MSYKRYAKNYEYLDITENCSTNYMSICHCIPVGLFSSLSLNTNRKLAMHITIHYNSSNTSRNLCIVCSWADKFSKELLRDAGEDAARLELLPDAGEDDAARLELLREAILRGRRSTRDSSYAKLARMPLSQTSHPDGAILPAPAS
jgi:hypothetical protein